MDAYQGTTDKFLRWFKSVGGEFRDDLIEIRDLRSKDSGRGIVAKKAIPRNTTLFKIPRHAIISIETSELAKKLPHVFDGDETDDDAEPLDSWGSLILVLIYEFLQGDASRWKPYIDILPLTFDTPLFWSEEELKELEGTVLTAEKIGKKESDTMLRSRILPLIFQNPVVFFAQGVMPLNKDELLGLAHRMGSTIMAYAFDLEDDDDESEDGEDGWVEDREGRTLLGMVPMADLLNANTEFNAHIDHGECLEVNSLRTSIPAGSEILNYYGPLPSSELLRRYGYVTAEHHRYDIIELPWSSIQSTLGRHMELPINALQDVYKELKNDDLEDCFVIARDSGIPSTTGRLTHPAILRDIPPELYQLMLPLIRNLDKRLPNWKRQGKVFIRNYYDLISHALHVQIEQYPTTIDQDEQLLATGTLSKRHRMAVEIRLGEKKLRIEALELMFKNVGRIDTKSSDDDVSSDDIDEDRTVKRTKITA